MSYHYDASTYRRVFDEDFTFIGGFWRNVDRYANSPALYETADDRSWTYAELWARRRRGSPPGWPSGASARGTSSSSSSTTAPSSPSLWLAAQRLGAVASPINFRLSSGRDRPRARRQPARASSSTTRR